MTLQPNVVTEKLENVAEDPTVYETAKGKLINSRIEDFLKSREGKALRGKVNLIVTSPPFPLLRQKKYGNETGKEYLNWLKSLAPKLAKLLTDDGSIVIEIGNAWERGDPIMSTLPLEALLAFQKAAGLATSRRSKFLISTATFRSERKKTSELISVPCIAKTYCLVS
ncbi:hypothetical protein DMC25_21015 [Caulobacter sp. D4A]|uniref:DNA methyltransferase n=1 Tax=unclassified Caulobacter TaxID=2648921 RepID=UPI000D73B61D|nr:MULTISPECIES: DNA methyltransferase [unclassified Caulobacter]PXA80764.1 hypothetical protein DMC25_21015 [Caulobacter sp. D4A]PXA91675.1 hypothetical protein DMC18_12555 [Caulobacter sp. D5]